MNYKLPVHWGNKFSLGREAAHRIRGKKGLLLAPNRHRLEKMLAFIAAHPLRPSPRVTLAMKNPYDVRPGQVWANKDSRCLSPVWEVRRKAGPRWVKVHSVVPPYAVCFWCAEDGYIDPQAALKVSRIRLDMFRPAEVRATRCSNAGWRLKEPF